MTVHISKKDGADVALIVSRDAVVADHAHNVGAFCIAKRLSNARLIRVYLPME